MLKILHCVTSIGAEAAGPSYSIPSLGRALNKVDCKVSIYSLDLDGPSPQAAHYNESMYIDRRYPMDFSWLRGADKLSFSRALRVALIEAAEDADVLHSHSLWRMPNIYPSVAARRAGKPLIISTRGTLSESALKISSLSKRTFWTLAQRDAVKVASAFHATSEQEYRDIRKFGLPQPVAIIPNGIDIPDLFPSTSPVADIPTVLFLGRLHRIKAIDCLIRAWHLLGDQNKRFRLLIAGPSEKGHEGELRRLAADLGLGNIAFRGPVYGTDKLQLLQCAELFVQPSHSENFAIAVAESLAAGTPVIASFGTPWQGLEANNCGWWVDNSPEALANALSAAMSLSSEERAVMGQRGRDWMNRDFSWSGVASQMAAVYEWLSHAGSRPDCVRDDMLQH